MRISWLKRVDDLRVYKYHEDMRMCEPIELRESVG